MNAFYFRLHANLMNNNPFKLLNILYSATIATSSHSIRSHSCEKHFEEDFFLLMLANKSHHFHREIHKFIKSKLIYSFLQLKTKNSILKKKIFRRITLFETKFFNLEFPQSFTFGFFRWLLV